MSIRYVILIFGILAGSSAILFIKLSELDPILLSSYRCLAAGVMLLPLFLRDVQRSAWTWSRLMGCLIPSCLLSLHFISWIIGARLTDAANGTLIVNLVPMVMPFILFLLVGERINRPELRGTAIALTGVLILGIFDYRFRPEHFVGDVITFGSMLLYALYLAWGRHSNLHFPSLFLYVVPVYLLSGVMSLAIAVTAGSRPAALPPVEWLWVLSLAFFPTVLGHSILNYGMRILRGQIVSLLNLFQFVGAAMMAYLVLGEVPSLAFYPMSVLIVLGVWTVLRSDANPPIPPLPMPSRRVGTD